MGVNEQLSVAVPAEMLKSVNDAVASGEYASASAVVQEALRDWENRKADTERLRLAWQEGIASSPTELVDFDALKLRGRARLAGLKE